MFLGIKCGLHQNIVAVDVSCRSGVMIVQIKFESQHIELMDDLFVGAACATRASHMTHELSGFALRLVMVVAGGFTGSVISFANLIHQITVITARITRCDCLHLDIRLVDRQVFRLVQ